MTRKKIGETFSSELASAGLLGLPFSWGEDGSITFGPEMPEEKKASVMDVYAAHSPESPTLPGNLE